MSDDDSTTPPRAAGSGPVAPGGEPGPPAAAERVDPPGAQPSGESGPALDTATRGGADDLPGDPPAQDPAEAVVPAQRSRPRGGFFRELPFLVVVAFALALVIKAFLVQAFYIPSGSMEQTLAIRDRVLVNKLVYDFRDIRRGEVVVFNGAGSFSPDPDQEVFTEPSNPVQRVLRKVGSAVGLGAPGEKDFIKRVIGVPGDRVACCTNGHVTVQPAGGTPVELVEPYTYENDSPMSFCQAGADEASCPAGSPGVLVPAGRLFVMGDHRCCSSDSRLHLDDGQMGTVPEKEVIGRAFVVVWPVGHATLLKVPGAFDDRALALPAAAATAVPYALGAVGGPARRSAPSPTPAPPAVRTSSKLVVVDPGGRVLLLSCVDPAAPQTRWQELPGGGVEQGEDAVQAGVREVLEEAGVVVPAAVVGPLQWTQVAAFSWLGRRHVARHEARVARLPAPPEVGPAALTEAERGTVLGQAWWTPQEVAAHPGRFFPRSLPALLPRLLAGERVDEPYDDWDRPDPPPPAAVDRSAARVLLVDAADRVLLLHGSDPADAALGDWWFTPGGGLDDGESQEQAALRELAEETGLVLGADDLGPVVHERVTDFTFGGTTYRQAEVFYLVRVDHHEVDTSGWTAVERASVTGTRWWPRADLMTTAEQVFPPDLARVLAQAIG